MRHTTFRVTAMRTHGLLTDWGIAGMVLPAIAKMRRTQLVLVLAGHGYCGGKQLRAGDIVVSDQGLVEPEGYGGSPCEVVHVEWDDDSYFGRAHEGPFTIAQMRRRDVDALRLLLANAWREPPSRWVRDLGGLLGSLGLDRGRLRRAAALAPHQPLSTGR